LQPSCRFSLAGIVLLLLSGDPAIATEPPLAEGTVNGCVELEGQGSYRGVASLWPAGEAKGPDPRRAIRPPLVSRPMGEDGCFSLKADPGEYFIGAIVRQSEGGWQGPPRVGDRVFLSPDPAGGQMKVTLQSGKTVDIGRHASGWTYTGFTAPPSALFITGTLTDTGDKPLAGLLVFAFTDSAMSKEPLAVSEPSDVNGHYLLRLPEPATVYLRVRENYGRKSPLEGGYMGVYGGDTPQFVAVDDNGDNQPRDLKVLLLPPQQSSRRKQLSPTPPP
jgi:hypothetical protein